MDPLSDIIALLRPRAAFSKPIAGRGRWGVRYLAYGLPGFALVLAGRCWLAVDGAEPVLIDCGDFVLLPSTPAFSLLSQPDAESVLVEPSYEALRHGDPAGEPDFQMLGGTFEIEPVNAPLLLALLPKMIHVRSTEENALRLGRVIGLLMEECAADAPGREMILQRLLEVMMMECLRSGGLGEGDLPAGLLAALRTPALAKVLNALHSKVRAPWTVAELAKIAGMSRSAFAARFTVTLGCAPMEYLSRWRMTLAQDALSRGDTPLDRLAQEVGYESASAFSTAFRRRIGCSPGAFARSRRAAAMPAAGPVA